MVSEECPTLISDARALYRHAVRCVQADRLLTPKLFMQAVDATKPVRVAAFGKAAMALAGVVEQHAGTERVEGLAVVPWGYRTTLPDFAPMPQSVEIVDGGHPLPTEASARAACRLLDLASSCTADDTLLILISGGGTALTSAPAGDLHVDDLRATYTHLMHAGVGIHDTNVVRKHLTQVGGGQLAKAAAPAAVVALVVSDVPGDDPSTIASGPTVPDASTYADALRVLYRNDLWHTVPSAVRTHLADGAHGRRPETPDASHTCFDRTRTTLIGTNQTALSALRTEAEARGYTVRSVETGVEGEARDVGARIARRVCEADANTPTCWVWGGETTVTVTGDGTGGRNQEVALGAALELDGATRPAVVLSGGTDGIDGPTDAAGAWATPTTVAQAEHQGIDPSARLANNDAYAVFDALNALLRPGPTHTNVMDVGLALTTPS